MTGKDFTVTLKDQSSKVRCYRLAAIDGAIKFALLSGSKAALMACQGLMADHGLVSCDSKTYQGAYLPTLTRKQIDSYDTYVLALRDEDAHCIWTGESLYLSLLALYTTPILPGWQEYLTEVMVARKMLRRMDGFGPLAWWIDMKQSDLDALIASGLRTKRILIPTESECAATKE